VLSGELNNPVLILNLTDSSGEPGYLAVRQLVRDPRQWTYSGQRVYVCENPAATTNLLRQLAATGATVHYHGDFD
jgi:hypothetical protein